MAEGARLESVYTATYRGFESLPHRHLERRAAAMRLFLYLQFPRREGEGPRGFEPSVARQHRVAMAPQGGAIAHHPSLTAISMKRALSKDRALFIVQIRRLGLVRFRLGQLGRFANLPLAGRQGGKRPCPLNPWPGRMPTAGKTPSYGRLSIGREPHAIHGVTLPLTVILTAHRLHSPLHSARQTASGFYGTIHKQKPSSSDSTSDLLTRSYFNPALFDLTHKSP